MTTLPFFHKKKKNVGLMDKILIACKSSVIKMMGVITPSA